MQPIAAPFDFATGPPCFCAQDSSLVARYVMASTQAMSPGMPVQKKTR